MARPKHCQTIDMTGAPLSEDFGYNLAVKWFGQEAVDSLPEFVRGKNKGKKKGFIRWRKVTVAGYEAGHGRAFAEGQTIWGWISKSMYGGSQDAAPGRWMGRVQGLSGSHSLLNEAARERNAIRLAAELAEADADFEERMDGLSADEREQRTARREARRVERAAETAVAEARALKW